MSSSDSLYLLEETVYTDIEKLSADYSWEQLSEMALYKGVNSMKNIVRNRSHSLSFPRGLLLLRSLSMRGEHFLHKHSIDTNSWMVVPRSKVEITKGSLKNEHHELMRQMFLAEEALKANNIRRLYDYYKFLNRLASMVQAEIQSAQVMLRKDLDVAEKIPRTWSASGAFRETQQQSKLPDVHRTFKIIKKWLLKSC